MTAPAEIVVPSFIEERTLQAQGYGWVAGVDEVGRGPLAGPLMAAAVVFASDFGAPWLDQVRDSKRLTPKRRETLCQQIREAAMVGVGLVPPEEIDDQGIGRAVKLAMGRAVADLPQRPSFLLIDAVRLPELGLPQKSIIGGDKRCLSIAAASIVAKVTRDHLMEELDLQYPGYGFAAHKGYGTKEHLRCLQELGPCRIHRRCFAPVKAFFSLDLVGGQQNAP